MNHRYGGKVKENKIFVRVESRKVFPIFANKHRNTQSGREPLWNKQTTSHFKKFIFPLSVHKQLNV